MNIIKKIAFRTFQTGFKLAIPVFPYRFPEIVDSVQKLPAVLQKKGIRRVLVVTDSSLNKSGKLAPLTKALTASHINFTIFDDTVPNPTVENVEAARTLYLKEHCQGLIGFGGGSAIDCAKAVGARIARPKKPIQKMKGILQILKKIPFLVAIPTTAGTGSETTITTVITDEKNAFKFPIHDFVLTPRVAVLDPETTKTLPPSLTATTGMDALTHAIEAYIGRSTTKMTRADALEASRLIAENLENAYHDGSDMTARSNMLQAAYLAGRSFTQSYIGYCHAVAHSLGGQYHIPHGLANAVILPYVLDSYGSAIYNSGKDIAIAMHLADKTTPKDVATRNLITHIRTMNENMGIPTKLKGIQEKDIPRLAAIAEKEANPLYPVPVLMSAKELEQFYYDVMEESK